MLKYFISIYLLTISINIFSQENELIDDVPMKTTFGIKIGLDVSKQIRMLTEPSYKGFVITGDYRLLEKLFLAGEFGYEKKKVYKRILFKTWN